MTNAAVISQVQGGYRAAKPELCINEVYALMLSCWHAKPSQRPAFAQLVKALEQLDRTTNASGGVSGREGSRPIGGDRLPTMTNASYQGAAEPRG